MAVNKVEYDGDTLMDLTEDSVAPEVLAEGETAHNAAGEPIIGTLKVQDEVVTTTGTAPAYVAQVKGITALVPGVNFIMIPHQGGISGNLTLNVNSLGAKKLYRLSSPGMYLLPGTLMSNIPYRVMYDGTRWLLVDYPKPYANDIQGAIPIDKGGVPLTNADNKGKVLTTNDSGIPEWQEPSGGEIDTSNLATVDKVSTIDMWYGDKRDISEDGVDGIQWRETFALLDDNDGELKVGTSMHRIPIVVGENITFEVDEEKQVVKINAAGGGAVYQGSSVDELSTDAPDGSLAVVTVANTETTWVFHDELDNLGESWDAWGYNDVGNVVSPFNIKYSYLGSALEFDGFGIGTQGSSSWGIYTLIFRQSGEEGTTEMVYCHNPSGSYGISHGWVNGDEYKTIIVSEADEEAKMWLEAHATKGGEGGTILKSTLYAKVNGEWVNVSSGGSGGSSDNSNGLEMPQIRFANFQDTRGNMTLYEGNPFTFTVEVTGGGALQEGDLLQICVRRKYWYKNKETDDIRHKWKLRQVLQREITAEDIGKRFLSITVTFDDVESNGNWMFRNDRKSLDSASYMYFRIKRVTQYGNDGSECNAIFSNIEKVAKTYFLESRKLTIK